MFSHCACQILFSSCILYFLLSKEEINFLYRNKMCLIKFLKRFSYFHLSLNIWFFLPHQECVFPNHQFSCQKKRFIVTKKIFLFSSVIKYLIFPPSIKNVSFLIINLTRFFVSFNPSHILLWYKKEGVSEMFLKYKDALDLFPQAPPRELSQSRNPFNI